MFFSLRKTNPLTGSWPMCRCRRSSNRKAVRETRGRAGLGGRTDPDEPVVNHEGETSEVATCRSVIGACLQKLPCVLEVAASLWRAPFSHGMFV